MKFFILLLFPFFMTSIDEVTQTSTTASESGKVCFFVGDLYTKNLNIKPESSENFSRKFGERKTITVQISGGDLGSGRIIAEVYDSSGNKVASGSSRFSFNTKNVKGNYKIVVKNKTKNLQKVKVTIHQYGS